MPRLVSLPLDSDTRRAGFRCRTKTLNSVNIFIDRRKTRVLLSVTSEILHTPLRCLAGGELQNGAFALSNTECFDQYSRGGM